MNHESSLSKVFIVSAVTAAIVGTVFGVYGPEVINQFGYLGLSPNDGSAEKSSFRIVGNESEQVAQIVSQYSQSVVSIVATKDLQVIENYRGFNDVCSDSFFRQFFGFCNLQPEVRTERRQIGAGTGFVVSENGLIATNKHVVQDGDAQYTVIMANGKTYDAKVVDRDPFQDLALIKIEASDLKTVPLGDSSSVRVGETVIAIGNALGEFSNSVSKGIVSGISRSVTASTGQSSERLEQLIQTDAAINPGNSGGPLLNLSGQVIGVNTAIVSGAQNLGFAIPIDNIKKAIEAIKSEGVVKRPYLGVRYVMIDQGIKERYKLNSDFGAFVFDPNGRAVISGSPAEKAGLAQSDIITHINGSALNMKYALSQAIQNLRVGDRVILNILRGSNKLELNVVLEEVK